MLHIVLGQNVYSQRTERIWVIGVDQRPAHPAKLQRHTKWNALFVCLFVWTAGFGLDDRGGHIAQAGWAGPWAMSAASFPLSIKHVFCLYILRFFVFGGVSGRCITFPSTGTGI